MSQIMAEKQADAKRQLDSYAQTTHQTIASDLAAQQVQTAGRNTAQTAPNAAKSEKEQQLAMKQQEITALEDWIRGDIRNKAAKIAAENGLEAVVTNVKVNVNAKDITDALIAACNK